MKNSRETRHVEILAAEDGDDGIVATVRKREADRLKSMSGRKGEKAVDAYSRNASYILTQAANKALRGKK
jgi:hypothetical protein